MDSALIQKVSRSFGLTLRLIPKKYRPTLTTAYLLARYADTLTDLEAFPQSQRLSHLELWENAILHGSHLWTQSSALKGLPGAEGQLLNHGSEILENFEALEASKKQTVLKVMKRLIDGMKFDLEYFSDSDGGLKSLETDEQLDWYCFHIAGCVGEFWVEVFELQSRWIESAVAYGKGLQRINIMRDLQDDLQRKRSYFPVDDPVHFFASDEWQTYRKNFNQKTYQLLLKGEDFCNSIIGRPLLRWASFLPCDIGIKTLKELDRRDPYCDRIKINRRSVRRSLISSGFRSFSGLRFNACHREKSLFKSVS